MDYWGQPFVNQATGGSIDSSIIAVTGTNGTAGTLVGYASGSRFTDDVIMTNVIGFDVKAWDPVAGVYVDLGQNAGMATLPLQGNMQAKSGLCQTPIGPPYIYDTWTDYYETAGTASSSATGRLHDGFDNGITPTNSAGYGMVDGPLDAITSPPYPVPLRGIQVKIRAFEPDSRSIREVTVTQDFLPK